MLRHSNEIIGCTIHATDGNIGTVKELYLDRRRWMVRYFAVETGSWLSRRQVLIPATAAPRQDISNREISVNLTKDQVRNSPDIDYTLPLSRSREVEIARHYQIPEAGWETPGGPVAVYIAEEDKSVTASGDRISVLDEQTGNLLETAGIPDAGYLYSLKELRGYTVFAHDGKVGDIDGLIVNDATWHARFAVVDAAQWLPGRHVLLSPRWFEDMNDDTSEIHVNLTRDVVRSSPPYTAGRTVSPAYESSLIEYYARDTSVSPFARWSFSNKRQAMPAGRRLVVEVQAPATVRWTGDNWRSFRDVTTHEIRGRHIAELSTGKIPAGESIHFTFFWNLAGHWENQNFSVRIVPALRRERVPAGV